MGAGLSLKDARKQGAWQMWVWNNCMVVFNVEGWKDEGGMVRVECESEAFKDIVTLHGCY